MSSGGAARDAFAGVRVSATVGELSSVRVIKRACVPAPPPARFAAEFEEAAALGADAAHELGKQAREHRLAFTHSPHARALDVAGDEIAALLHTRLQPGIPWVRVGSAATGGATRVSDLDVCLFLPPNAGGASTDVLFDALSCGARVCAIESISALAAAAAAFTSGCQKDSGTSNKQLKAERKARKVQSTAAREQAKAALLAAVNDGIAPTFECVSYSSPFAGSPPDSHTLARLRHVATGVIVDVVASALEQRAVTERVACVRVLLETCPVLADMHAVVREALGASVCARDGSYSEANPLTGHAVLLLCRLTLREPAPSGTSAWEANGRALLDALGRLAAVKHITASSSGGIVRLKDIGSEDTVKVTLKRVKRVCAAAHALRLQLLSGSTVTAAIAHITAAPGKDASGGK